MATTGSGSNDMYKGVEMNNLLDETMECLTKQMIQNNFKNKGSKEEKYLITKQELYNFSIKLIKVVKEAYNNG